MNGERGAGREAPLLALVPHVTLIDPSRFELPSGAYRYTPLPSLLASIRTISLQRLEAFKSNHLR